LRPAEDIHSLRRALKPHAGVFVLNNLGRAVPTRERNWANDGIDIKQMLAAEFNLEREGQLPSDVAPTSLSQLTYWASFVNDRSA
jgi:hypothetical protein